MSVLQHSLRGLALLLAFNTITAHATIISNTLDGSTGNAAKSLTSRAAAGSFTANASGTLGNLEIDLAQAATTGSISITLNTNNAGVPGTVLSQIATLAASAIPNSETLYSFFNLPVTGLTPGSTYWIEVAKLLTATGAEAFTTTTPAAVGTGQTYWPGTTPTSTSPLLTFCVSSDNACSGAFPATAAFSFNAAAPAPEPATIAIIGAGLAGLGWVRRRSSHTGA